MKEKLIKFYEHLKELNALYGTSALLGWDKSTYMPKGGSSHRAYQMSVLSQIIHNKSLDKIFVTNVDSLYDSIDELSDIDAVNVRETKRTIDQARKLPEKFVVQFSELRELSSFEWEKARPGNDFKSMIPHLEKLVEMSRQKAEYLGYEDCPYDALHDLYEPGATYKNTRDILVPCGKELTSLIMSMKDKYSYSQKPVPLSSDTQYKLCWELAKDIGYLEFSGRLDSTTHPYMTTIGRNDSRILTNYREDNFLYSVFCTIHETGHALYSLGYKEEHFGTPMAAGISLGIHESQSRLWENQVARSKAYSEYFYRKLEKFHPEQAKKINTEELWLMCNNVKPGLIRTEADEVTYTLHIIVRMIIEAELIEGDIEVIDLPKRWGDLYEEYLGVKPKDDKDGVMQDVHWQTGSFGYFPTYALGNLYAAMMYEQALVDLPRLEVGFVDGNFEPLLKWLRVNVHQHGKRYTGRELIKNITGKELDYKPFITYLKNKFS